MTLLRGLLVAFALSGCASTSGREWIDSPIDAQARPAEASGVAAEAEPVPEARPRLRETITLGESYAVASDAAPPVGGPTLQVNVHTQVPVIINNPAGYGYGYGYGYGSASPYYRSGSFSTPARATTRSAAPKVGADFPAVPDYGPRALR